MPKRQQCQKGKAQKGNKTKKAKPQKAAAKMAKAEEQPEPPGRPARGGEKGDDLRGACFVPAAHANKMTRMGLQGAIPAAAIVMPDLGSCQPPGAAGRGGTALPAPAPRGRGGGRAMSRGSSIPRSCEAPRLSIPERTIKQSHSGQRADGQ